MDCELESNPSLYRDRLPTSCLNHSMAFEYQVYEPGGECSYCRGAWLLFGARIVSCMWTVCIDKIQRFLMLKEVVFKITTVTYRVNAATSVTTTCMDSATCNWDMLRKPVNRVFPPFSAWQQSPRVSSLHRCYLLPLFTRALCSLSAQCVVLSKGSRAMATSRSLPARIWRVMSHTPSLHHLQCSIPVAWGIL